MTIDPKEKTFLDNLKNEFKGDDGKITKIEHKVLDALERKFNEKDTAGNDVVTGANEIMKVVNATLQDEKASATKDVSDASKALNDIESAARKAGNVTGGIGKKIGQGLGKLFDSAEKATKETLVKNRKEDLQEIASFNKDHPRIPELAANQLPPKTIIVSAAVDKPADVATSTPAAATHTETPVSSANITPKEEAFLKKLKEDFTVGGKMNGIKTAVYKAVETEFAQSPGQTGWRQMAEVAATAHSQVITDVKSGKIKISDAVDLPVDKTKDDKAAGTKGHRAVRDSNIPDQIAEIEGKLKPDNTREGGYKGVIAAQQDVIKGLGYGSDKKARDAAETKIARAQKQIVSAETDLSEMREAAEAGITTQFDWRKVTETAKSSNFPEKSDTSLQSVIRAAAGADNKLDSQELKNLVGSAAFKNAAKSIDKIGVKNGADAKDDVLNIGGTDISLGEMKLELDSSVQDGDVSAPKAAPAAKPSTNKPAKKAGKGH